jgi:hypothetical protein
MLAHREQLGSLLIVLWFAAWPQRAGAQWHVDGAPVCTAAGDQLHHASVSDGAGGAIVTWQDSRGTNYDIYAQHVLASGAVDPAWPADGLALCATAGDQTEGMIVSDGAGGAIVTWQDFRNGTDQDIYAQHIEATGAVDPAWPADGRALCTAASNQWAPRIDADGVGGAIVAWYDFRGGPSDIYAQHVLASGVVDPSWPTDGRAICTGANHQVYPAIIADGAGGAIITWNDGRIVTNTYNDVYAQHVLASGAVDPAWPTDGRALCTAGYKQSYPSPTIVADGAGGAIVAWGDNRGSGGYADIYAQHVLANGAVDPAWPANGRAVCTEANDQGNPAMIADGAGGAIVTWQDNRSYGTYYDIYTQHVLASGVVDPVWTANGTLLCNAANDQTFPTIVTDGAGGAIVTWDDYRGGVNDDVYAQHVLTSGVAAAIYTGRSNRLAVHDPRPNPTHAGTTLVFDLPTAQHVSVKLYDVAGKLVRTLAADRDLPAGSQSLVWDGATDSGAPARAGIYFIRVTMGSASVARRVAVLR